MLFDLKTHQKGFIQLLPLVLLAAFAVTTLVIANRVTTQQQDIRSQALAPSAGQKVVPPPKPPTTGGGGAAVLPPAVKNIVEPPKPAPPAPKPQQQSGLLPAPGAVGSAPQPAAQAPQPAVQPQTGGGAGPQQAGVGGGGGGAAAPAPAAGGTVVVVNKAGDKRCFNKVSQIYTGKIWQAGGDACAPVAPKPAASTTTTTAPATTIITKAPTCYEECLAVNGSPSECKSLPTCSTASTGGGTGCTVEGQCNAYYQKTCHYDAVSKKFILTTACTIIPPVPAVGQGTTAPAGGTPASSKVKAAPGSAIATTVASTATCISGCNGDIKCVFFQCIKPPQPTPTTPEIKYHYDINSKQCVVDNNGKSLAECKREQGTYIEAQAYANCLQGAQRVFCESLLTTYGLDTTSDPPTCVKKPYGVSAEECQKQLTDYQQKQMAQSAPAIAPSNVRCEFNDGVKVALRQGGCSLDGKTAYFCDDTGVGHTSPCPGQCVRGSCISPPTAQGGGGAAAVTTPRSVVTTPAPTTCSGLRPNCASGYTVKCRAPNWTCERTTPAPVTTTTAPKPVTTTTAPKPVITAPTTPTQYYRLNTTTRACEKVAFSSTALTLTECNRRLAALPVAAPSTNKLDITGAVNPACCTFSSDCPTGQTCDVKNGQCKSGWSCRPPATTGPGSDVTKICNDNFCSSGQCITKEFQGKVYAFCDRPTIERDFILINAGEVCPRGVGSCYCRNSEIPEGTTCSTATTTITTLTQVCQQVCGADSCSQEGTKITCACGLFGSARCDKYQLQFGDRCPPLTSPNDCTCAIPGGHMDNGICVTSDNRYLSSIGAVSKGCDNGSKFGASTCAPNYNNLVQICANPTASGQSQYTFHQCDFDELCQNGSCVVTSNPDVKKNFDSSTAQNFCGNGFHWVNPSMQDPVGKCVSNSLLVKDGYVSNALCGATCNDIDGCSCLCTGSAGFGEKCATAQNIFAGLQEWQTRNQALSHACSTGALNPLQCIGLYAYQVADIPTLGTISGTDTAIKTFNACNEAVARGTRLGNCIKEALDVGTNSLSASASLIGVWNTAKNFVGRLFNPSTISVAPTGATIALDDVGLGAEFKGVAEGTIVQVGEKRFLLEVDAAGKQVLRELSAAEKVIPQVTIDATSGVPCLLPKLSGNSNVFASSNRQNVLGISNLLALERCKGGWESLDRPPGGGGGVAVYDDAGKPIELPAKPIGSGFYSSVYADYKNNSAIKILRPHVSGSPTFLESVDNEIQFYKDFGGQANIAKFKGYVYNAQGKVAGYQQELIAGETLESFYNKGGKLTQKQIDQAVTDLKQIQEVTGQAHGDIASNGKIFNPENIIVQPDGTIRFIDFTGAKPSELTFTQQNELNAVQEGLKAYAQ